MITVVFDPPACVHCGHFACVCAVRAGHVEGCRPRLAGAGAVAIECEHGRDVCPECDPCTCTCTYAWVAGEEPPSADPGCPAHDPGPADLADCPWYRGVGICDRGCLSEPACQTMEPEGGWPSVRGDRP
jgi:hypothetical protein